MSVMRKIAGMAALLIMLAVTATANDMIEAVKADNLTAVGRLIADNPQNATVTDERNCTALHYAVNNGNIEIARYLLDHGAAIEAADVDGDTPAMWAAFAGNVDMLKFLQSRGADLGVANRSGQTILHYAVLGRSTEVVESVLEGGVNINAADYEGETALHYAILRGNLGLAEILLNHNADTELKNNYGRTPLLHVARETGNLEMATLLITHGADINVQDKSGASPLGLAAWRHFRGLVDYFLEQGAVIPDDDTERQTLAQFAVEGSLNSLFDRLQDGGIDLTITNDNGGSLLHSAADGGSTEIIKMLLDNGLDIKQTDRYGRTPLHYAVEKGRINAVQMLIDRGANINAVSLAGYTPLMVAEQYRREHIVKILTGVGAASFSSFFHTLHGPFFGQTPPESEATILAPDIVSSNRFEHGTVTFSPDGAEAYWSTSFRYTDSGYTHSMIYTSKIVDGHWTEPAPAPFSELRMGDDVPFFSPDGSRLYFVSGRPVQPDGSSPGEKIWYVDRTADGWSEPQIIAGGPNSMDLHWQFSVATNGNIYFSSGAPGGMGMGDIYVSRFSGGVWAPPENIGTPVNSVSSEGSPYIAPDESYLIITTNDRPGAIGGMDLYISFRTVSGGWSEPVCMGESVNSSSNEICPMMTSDGRYFIFNSFRSGNADNYWVDGSIIETLKATR